MKKNVGSIDKIVRVVLALVFAGLYFGGVVTGYLGIALVVFGVVFLATSFMSFCPLYTLFGMSTCPREEKKA